MRETQKPSFVFEAMEGGEAQKWGGEKRNVFGL